MIEDTVGFYKEEVLLEEQYAGCGIWDHGLQIHNEAFQNTIERLPNPQTELVRVAVINY